MRSMDWFRSSLPHRRVVEFDEGLSPERVFSALFGDEPAAFWIDRTVDDGVSLMGSGARLAVARLGELEGWAGRDLVGWLAYDDRFAAAGGPGGAAASHRAVEGADGEPVAEFVAAERAAMVGMAGRIEFAAASPEALEKWVREATARLARAGGGGLQAEGAASGPAGPEDGPGAGAASGAAGLEVASRVGAASGTGDMKRGPGAGAASEVLARWGTSRREHLERVLRCQEAITRGDAYVINLSTEVGVAGVFDEVEVFARLRERTPARWAGLIRLGGRVLVSASPEEFLRVSAEGMVSTSPVKGTRRRSGAGAESDRREVEELRRDEKERAENVMIVDLMRNDLERVCEPASVAVSRLLDVETLPHLHQLVSTVEGRLRAGLTRVDAMEACFPAGSMTGAPKISAMRLIAQIEGRRRGLYAGAFGYVGGDGETELAMTIRAVVIGPDGARVAAGGGITAGSVPEREAAEVELKAAPLLRALGVSEVGLRMPEA